MKEHGQIYSPDDSDAEKLRRLNEELDRYKDPIEQAEAIVENELLCIMGRHNTDITELRSGTLPKEKAKRMVREINSTFNLYANKRGLLYEAFRVRFFEIGDKHYFIAMGAEDESVDIRRQGNFSHLLKIFFI